MLGECPVIFPSIMCRLKVIGTIRMLSSATALSPICPEEKCSANLKIPSLLPRQMNVCSVMLLNKQAFSNSAPDTSEDCNPPGGLMVNQSVQCSNT